MKRRRAVYMFLSVLEGLLSGGYFYLGRRDRDALSTATGCVWLAASVFHGLLGTQKEEHILLVEEDDYE